MWVQVWLYLFLISALDGGKWSTSRLGDVTPENNSGIHLEGNWMCLRAGLGVLKKIKKILPLPGFEPLTVLSV
jgi:hypothetical protein